MYTRALCYWCVTHAGRMEKILSPSRWCLGVARLRARDRGLESVAELGRTLPAEIDRLEGLFLEKLLPCPFPPSGLCVAVLAAFPHHLDVVVGFYKLELRLGCSLFVLLKCGLSP